VAAPRAHRRRLSVTSKENLAYAAIFFWGPLPGAAKATVMSYYEVPADVLEARDRLTSWAQKALRVAIRKKKK